MRTPKGLQSWVQPCCTSDATSVGSVVIRLSTGALGRDGHKTHHGKHEYLGLRDRDQTLAYVAEVFVAQQGSLGTLQLLTDPAEQRE